MIFSIKEIIDMIIMVAAIGYIFKDTFKAPQSDDPLEAYKNQRKNNFYFAIAAVAPAIILHELGHKFAAMALGLTATFKAAYSFLALGVGLKLLGFPFVFFIPAYVTHPVTIPSFSAVISIMGPLVNAAMAGFCYLALKHHWFDEKYRAILQISVTVNGFLFILNMLPIPGIDGFAFYKSILSLLF